MISEIVRFYCMTIIPDMWRLIVMISKIVRFYCMTIILDVWCLIVMISEIVRFYCMTIIPDVWCLIVMISEIVRFYCMTIIPDVWAFDSDAVKALKDMKPMDMEKLVAKYSILLDPDSELLPQNKPNTLVGVCRK
jgi:myo-inositol catabolism protein IolC